MFQGGFVSWFLFYSFLPFGLYAVVVLLYPLKKWNVTRDEAAASIRWRSFFRMTFTLHAPRLFLFIWQQ